MNHKRYLITAPVLAVAALALTASESNAKDLPEDSRPAAVVRPIPGPPNYPSYDPASEVPPLPSTEATVASNDTTTEVLQAGASALGGAGIAFACMWLYRRHQTHIA